MAQEMGARLGRGEVLFGAVSGGEGEGRDEGSLAFVFSGARAGEAGRIIGDPGLGDERRGPPRFRERFGRREGTRRR